MKLRAAAVAIPAMLLMILFTASRWKRMSEFVPDQMACWFWPLLVSLVFLAGVGIAVSLRNFRWIWPPAVGFVVQTICWIPLLTVPEWQVEGGYATSFFWSGGFALVAVLVLFFIWLATSMRRGLLERTLLDGSAGPGGGDPRQLEQIRKNMEEALKILKQAGQGRNAIYELPWFLVIGRPAAGKTVAIKNSGLNLPVRKDWVKGIGGTFTCDWFFTNDLIFLDTPGRWVMEGADEAGKQYWRQLLKLLMRYRGRRPLDGLAVVVPVDDLLGLTTEELEDQASRIREIVDLITETIRFQFPVYVLVSKCDLLDGFVDFFQALPPERKHEILGWSNEDPNRSDVSKLIQGGFRRVRERLEGYRLEMMARAPRRSDARRLFFFTEEFRELEEPLRAFTKVLFADDQYRETPVFRGFYFTSGTQGEGSPIARASSRLASEMALAGPAEVPASAGQKRGYFLLDLFRELMVTDRGLVGRSALQWLKQRRDTMFYAFIPAFLALVALAWCTTSWLVALGQFDQVREGVKTHVQDIDRVLGSPTGEVVGTLGHGDQGRLLKATNGLEELLTKKLGPNPFHFPMMPAASLRREVYPLFRDGFGDGVLGPTVEASRREIYQNEECEECLGMLRAIVALRLVGLWTDENSQDFKDAKAEIGRVFGEGQGTAAAEFIAQFKWVRSKGKEYAGRGDLADADAWQKWVDTYYDAVDGLAGEVLEKLQGLEPEWRQKLYSEFLNSAECSTVLARSSQVGLDGMGWEGALHECACKLRAVADAPPAKLTPACVKGLAETRAQWQKLAAEVALKGDEYERNRVARVDRTWLRSEGAELLFLDSKDVECLVRFETDEIVEAVATLLDDDDGKMLALANQRDLSGRTDMDRFQVITRIQEWRAEQAADPDTKELLEKLKAFESDCGRQLKWSKDRKDWEKLDALFTRAAFTRLTAGPDPRACGAEQAPVHDPGCPPPPSARRIPGFQGYHDDYVDHPHPHATTRGVRYEHSHAHVRPRGSAHHQHVHTHRLSDGNVITHDHPIEGSDCAIWDPLNPSHSAMDLGGTMAVAAPVSAGRGGGGSRQAGPAPRREGPPRGNEPNRRAAVSGEFVSSAREPTGHSLTALEDHRREWKQALSQVEGVQTPLAESIRTRTSNDIDSYHAAYVREWTAYLESIMLEPRGDRDLLDWLAGLSATNEFSLLLEPLLEAVDAQDSLDARGLEAGLRSLVRKTRGAHDEYEKYVEALQTLVEELGPLADDVVARQEYQRNDAASGARKSTALSKLEKSVQKAKAISTRQQTALLAPVQDVRDWLADQGDLEPQLRELWGQIETLSAQIGFSTPTEDDRDNLKRLLGRRTGLVAQFTQLNHAGAKSGTGLNLGREARRWLEDAEEVSSRLFERDSDELAPTLLTLTLDAWPSQDNVKVQSVELTLGSGQASLTNPASKAKVDLDLFARNNLKGGQASLSFTLGGAAGVKKALPQFCGKEHVTDCVGPHRVTEVMGPWAALKLLEQGLQAAGMDPANLRDSGQARFVFSKTVSGQDKQVFTVDLVFTAVAAEVSPFFRLRSFEVAPRLSER